MYKFILKPKEKSILNKLKFYFILLIIFSCQSKDMNKTKNQWKEEIRKTEKAFAELLEEKGIHDAFVHFADDEAVLMRENKLIIGKQNIDLYYKGSYLKSLIWSPDFVDVSSSGDLGYTYGSYQFKFKDSLGNEKVSEGIFHTVWKRQADGAWKFVWD